MVIAFPILALPHNHNVKALYIWWLSADVSNENMLLRQWILFTKWQRWLSTTTVYFIWGFWCWPYTSYRHKYEKDPGGGGATSYYFCPDVCVEYWKIYPFWSTSFTLEHTHYEGIILQRYPIMKDYSAWEITTMVIYIACYLDGLVTDKINNLQSWTWVGNI